MKYVPFFNSKKSLILATIKERIFPKIDIFLTSRWMKIEIYFKPWSPFLQK